MPTQVAPRSSVRLHAVAPAIDVPEGPLPVDLVEVLLADGDPIAIQVLGRILSDAGYRVRTALTLDQAWSDFTGHLACRILVCDWSPSLAPLIGRVRSSDRGRFTYVVAMARHAARVQVGEAMAAGADDVLSKPFFHEILLQRLLVARRTLALQDDLLAQGRELAVANQRLHDDLAMAARVQRALLPGPSACPGVGVAWHYEPCEELGGDLLGHCRLADGRLACWLLDVSGHGVSSALLAVQVGRHLEPEAVRSVLGEAGPAAMVARLNALFPMDPRMRQYFTIVIIDLDPGTGEVRWCCAGHPPPLLSTAEGAAILDGGGVAVGWMPPSRAVFREHRRRLRPGERLLLYSDGAIEATGPDGDIYGIERLQAQAGALAALPLEEAMAGLVLSLAGFVGDRGEHQDDISLLAVEYLPPTA